VVIVMIVSITFSFILYRISSRELNFGFQKQTRILEKMPVHRDRLRPLDFERMRLEQLDQSSRALRNNLILFNLIILFLSGALSYFLARKTLQPIEEMMEEQNRFTSDASHELRTPLTAIKTETEVGLRDKNLNLSNAKNLLKSNLEEVSKLEHLSNALLKLAQYETKKEMLFKNISLEDILTEAYTRVEKQANTRKIKFENKLKDVKIKGDKDSLTELFIILLENAIKYSHKNSKIFITIKKIKKIAVIKVKDQGIGIKASGLPYVFNRFYRSDSSRSKIKTDGYGLGLSIAKKTKQIFRLIS